MKTIIIYLIRIYQKIARFFHLQVCRFYPSCSEYMVESIQKKGILRGLHKGVCRLLQCNPFNPGGYDPVK